MGGNGDSIKVSMDSRLRGNDGAWGSASETSAPSLQLTVILANAGIHCDLDPAKILQTDFTSRISTSKVTVLPAKG